MWTQIKEFVKNYKKIILIILALLLLLLIIFFPKGKQDNKVSKPVDQSDLIPGEDIVSEKNINMPELTEDEKQIADITTIARTFAELFGSYSNQSNFINLESILPLLSARYRGEMQILLNKSRNNYVQGEVYKGVTTTVLNTRTEDLDLEAGTGTVIVKTQRQESEENRNNYKIKYQDLKLNFIRFNDNWLVDNVEWL